LTTVTEPQPTADTPPPQLVATFATYLEAQAAVDKLSDEGFPVSMVSIVWSNLRRVEYVTGRRTVLTAGRDGLVAGAYFGALLALIASFFITLEEGVTVLELIISWLVLGAAIGAVWSMLGHAFTRGRRDFSAIGKLEAEAYQLWVEDSHADQARTMLGHPRVGP
jgi:hypothetical protein